MSELENINFYYAYKKNNGGRKPKYKPSQRKVTKTTLFEEKVKRINHLSELINSKL